MRCNDCKKTGRQTGCKMYQFRCFGFPSKPLDLAGTSYSTWPSSPTHNASLAYSYTASDQSVYSKWWGSPKKPKSIKIHSILMVWNIFWLPCFILWRVSLLFSWLLPHITTISKWIDRIPKHDCHYRISIETWEKRWHNTYAGDSLPLSIEKCLL